MRRRSRAQQRRLNRELFGPPPPVRRVRGKRPPRPVPITPGTPGSCWACGDCCWPTAPWTCPHCGVTYQPQEAT